MSWWRAMLGEAKTRWLQGLNRRPVRVRLDRPIVSIAFDDVPVSAFHTGAPLLESFGVRGTFYVCLGLESAGPAAEYLGVEEIRELHRRGHEIGCHTFSHYRLSQGHGVELQSDARRNRDRLHALLGDGWPRSFSYPFGELSFEIKKGLAPYYQSLRGNRSGVNCRTADFNCLKAVSLERDNCSAGQLGHWLDLAERTTGWLIVYSHNVSSHPGYYDIRPETLTWLLRECRRRGVAIAPVWRAAEQVVVGSARGPNTGPAAEPELDTSAR